VSQQLAIKVEQVEQDLTPMQHGQQQHQQVSAVFMQAEQVVVLLMLALPLMVVLVVAVKVELMVQLQLMELLTQVQVAVELVKLLIMTAEMAVLELLL
jgi:hypothetical protein